MIHFLPNVARQYRGLVVVLIASLFLFSCASQNEKISSGAEQPRRISATGYTEFGCLINLKDEARQQRARQLVNKAFGSIPTTPRLSAIHLAGSFRGWIVKGISAAGVCYRLGLRPWVVIRRSIPSINMFRHGSVTL